MFLKKVANSVSWFLYHPKWVAFFGTVFFFFSVIYSGNFMKLWTLQQDQQRLQVEIAEIKQHQKLIAQKIQTVKDPLYIERQVRDRLDMVNEHDLVFVFTED